jgi:hypothetical protein
MEQRFKADICCVKAYGCYERNKGQGAIGLDSWSALIALRGWQHSVVRQRKARNLATPCLRERWTAPRLLVKRTG